MGASKEEPSRGSFGFLSMLPTEQALMGYVLGQQRSSGKRVYSQPGPLM